MNAEAMRGRQTVLDYVAWVAAILVAGAAIAVGVSPSGFAFKGDLLVLLFAGAFIVTWCALSESRGKRSFACLAFILGIGPFVRGACPKLRIQSSGAIAADRWLNLVEEGKDEEAFLQADLGLTVEEFRTLIQSSGLGVKSDRRFLARTDVASSTEGIWYHVARHDGTGRYVSVRVRVRYFLPPVVVAVLVEN